MYDDHAGLGIAKIEPRATSSPGRRFRGLKEIAINPNPIRAAVAGSGTKVAPEFDPPPVPEIAPKCDRQKS